MEKTIREVSEENDIPHQTLISAVKDGRLPAKKRGRDWFILIEEPEFKQFLESYRPKTDKK
jgi:hypothetical protein